jgi:hypothetical protein
MAEGQALTQRLVAQAAALRAWFGSPPGLRLQKWLSIGISAVILLVLARSIAGIGWRDVLAAVPADPLFWLLFAGSYFLGPLTDWWIYRRWWGLAFRDLAVFLKMRVMNDAIFSYSGHTYLLVWATGRLGIDFDPQAPPPRLLGRGGGPGVDPAESPFAAVKDMAITSGLAGNSATLLMLLAALGLGGHDAFAGAMDPGTLRWLLIVFASFIVLNLGIVLFRQRVMSIPARENIFAFGWHFVRVTLAQLFVMASWIVALPDVPLLVWVQLGALRMLLQRMPIPNREVLFAVVAANLAGDAAVGIAALMAAQGALQLVFHGVAWLAAAMLDAGSRSPRTA